MSEASSGHMSARREAARNAFLAGMLADSDSIASSSAISAFVREVRVAIGYVLGNLTGWMRPFTTQPSSDFPPYIQSGALIAANHCKSTADFREFPIWLHLRPS